MAPMMASGWYFGFASPAFLPVLTSTAKSSPGERPEGVGGESKRIRGNNKFPRSLICYLRPECYWHEMKDCQRRQQKPGTADVFSS